jgi:hypothetical protein
MTASMSPVKQLTVSPICKRLIGGKLNAASDLTVFSDHYRRQQSNGRPISRYRHRRQHSRNVYTLPISQSSASLRTAFNLRNGVIYRYLSISCQRLIKHFIRRHFQSKLTPGTGWFRFNGQRRYVAVSYRYGLLGKVPTVLLQCILTKGGDANI